MKRNSNKGSSTTWVFKNAVVFFTEGATITHRLALAVRALAKQTPPPRAHCLKPFRRTMALCMRACLVGTGPWFHSNNGPSNAATMSPMLRDRKSPLHRPPDPHRSRPPSIRHHAHHKQTDTTTARPRPEKYFHVLDYARRLLLLLLTLRRRRWCLSDKTTTAHDAIAAAPHTACMVASNTNFGANTAHSMRWPR